MKEFLEQTFFYNTWKQWFWLAGVLIFVIIFKRYISRLISMLLFRMVQKTDAGGLSKEFLLLILKPLQYFIVLQTMYIGFHTLTYPFGGGDAESRELVVRILTGTYRFLMILNVAWIISRCGDFFVLVLKHRAEKTEDPWDDQLVVFMKDIIRVVVWTLALLSILGIVFGVNIYSIIAGAGIAGIAIAFAAQETLQNIFGSISIFTEKPFVIGDLIEFDGTSGTVVKVGFRSTRIRTLDTAYMTVPNKTLMNAKLSNLTRRTSRRIYATLSLDFSTSPEQLKKIREEILQYGLHHPMRNEEVNVAVMHFSLHAIELLVEIHFTNISWSAYVDLRHDLMLRIMEIVRSNGAKFVSQPAFAP